jgi:tRNA (mo5U34)-methyltransferase
MTDLQQRAREVIKACPEWYHSIELAPGVVTPGRRPLQDWEEELRKLRLPDLHGKSVLDIGAYDGFFSFAAERLGASRVTSLDHYVWFTDMVAAMKDWRESCRTGTPLPPLDESPHWRPAELPGRRPFDAARALLGSRVEPVVGDFMKMDLTSLGRFDVVLFLGVLYHLEEPLHAMRRVASVTAPGGLAVIETEAMEILGLRGTAFCEFFPSGELNHDPSNWWAPNGKALEGLCRAAGFREVTLLSGPPLRTGLGALIRLIGRSRVFPKRLSNRVGANSHPLRVRYRAIAQARR